MELNIFWFRRDLRLEDNTALHYALNSGKKVLAIFIFDENILDELDDDDARVNFIYNSLYKINELLKDKGSSLLVLKGEPIEVWKSLIKDYQVDEVFANKDYEPYALKRDNDIAKLLEKNNIAFNLFKDQLIHEEAEVMKADGTPYTVFTPYKNKWLQVYKEIELLPSINYSSFINLNYPFPALEDIGFRESRIKVSDYNLDDVEDYAETRNFPNLNSTSHLGPHLRFGTVSIRQVIKQLNNRSEVFLSELIWREFFMQIMFHFPKVVTENFRSKYDGIQWMNNKDDFRKWCEGKTGYPLVDAGMRELNETGFMHNRVRMITAGFLCKHLLIDWRWGEAYFAKHLLDYELSSNNGNWQWAAGTGCDAAPYFRIFNPSEQIKKFDSNYEYIKKWLPEYNTPNYIDPIVEHTFARKRAIEKYKEGLGK